MVVELVVFLQLQKSLIKTLVLLSIISSLILIFLSIIISIVSVIPRFGSLEEKEKPALPYFRYVSKKIKNDKELLLKIKEQNLDDILEIMTSQSYELAKIADKKVAHVRYALLLFLFSFFSIIGFFSILLLFLNNKNISKKTKEI